MTREQFARLFPHVSLSREAEFCEAINAAMAEFGIDTPGRQAMFLAQVGHETGGLVWLQELGGPLYFRKYDGRRDLGNTEPGDGNRYHGRGLFQLTGRANYREYGRALGLDLEGSPDQAARIDVGARVAGLYWKLHSLNALADRGDIVAVTRKINGGLNGLGDREARWQIARRVMGA